MAEERAVLREGESSVGKDGPGDLTFVEPPFPGRGRPDTARAPNLLALAWKSPHSFFFLVSHL